MASDDKIDTSNSNAQMKGALMASDDDSKGTDEPKPQDAAFSAFTTPISPRYLDGLTGLCHCVARREGGKRNKRIIFYLESGHFGAPRPLFVAQKKKKGKFYIYDVSVNDYRITRRPFRKECLHYVGKIRRKRFPKSKIISNTLFLGTKDDKKQVASLVYDAVSLRSPVLEGYPDRRVYSIVQGSPDDASAESGRHSISPLRIDDIIRFHSKRISEITDRNLQVLPSRRRNGEPFRVRFRGRAGRASTKNLQIVNQQDEIVFQMARWNQDEFCVDFKNPYSAYTAFGIALAQLEV